jgi:chaperonin GroES
VTVSKTSQKTLAIRRNWKPDDTRKRRRLYFREYKFLPGLGGYGFGFLHIAGGLSDTSTGALRALLDAGALANLRGGYVSQDVVGLHDLPPITPGKWHRVPNSAEDLNKAFWSPNYAEPSQVLFNLLTYLDEQFGSLVSTTETLVGEDNKNTPVGTVLARIEQGLKVFSGIHRRCHTAQRAEFRIVADLAASYLPQVYPYDVPGESREVYATDFDDRVDVLPVSDPNIISNTQRVAQAQGIWELAISAPEVFDVRRAARGMLEAMRVPDVDEYLLPPPQPVDPNMPMPLDPMTEAKVRETDAKIMREDAKAGAAMEAQQAQQQMKASAMRQDAATQAAGDEARIAEAGAGELKRMEAEILEMAEARRMQQAQSVTGRKGGLGLGALA